MFLEIFLCVFYTSSFKSITLEIDTILSSFGILNIETGEEKLFFPLDNIRETRYYYGVPKENLKKDKNLHRKIVNQVKEKATKDTKASYGIFSTDYDTEYAYVLCYSSHVQEA